MPLSDAACPKTRNGKHQWQSFALGRICAACRLTQASDEIGEERPESPADAGDVPQTETPGR